MDISSTQISKSMPISIFKLEGDFSDGEKLIKSVEQAIKNGTTHVVLDLQHVPFISSMGLRAIHTIYEKLRQANQEERKNINRGIAKGSYKSPYLKLVQPSKNGLKALKVAGFDMFLSIFDNRDEAINSFER